MSSQVLLNLLTTAAVISLSFTAAAQEDEKEDPKKEAWIEKCMKESGWYNEDGMPYCSCLAGKFGTSKGVKTLKGTKAESTCAAQLPSKDDNPKRHWIAECVTSGGGDHVYCKCMGDKLTAPVKLEKWKKTKEGGQAHTACKT